MMESERQVPSKPACAACKHQGKMCGQECLLKDYFPAENERIFMEVQKIYDVQNIQKMLEQLRNEMHATKEQEKFAMKSLMWHALWWQRDPVQGCYGEYRRMQSEITKLKNQLDQAHSLLFHRAYDPHFIPAETETLPPPPLCFSNGVRPPSTSMSYGSHSPLPTTSNGDNEQWLPHSTGDQQQ